MKHNVKKAIATFKQKAIVPVIGVSTALILSVPAFAEDTTAASATIDPALFDPLVTGVTSNITAVLPKILVVVALLVGLGVVIGLFKKHARPS